MKENKDIELSNSAFDLKIHWNAGFMSMQGAVLLGCGALWICSKSQSVHAICGLVLVVDVIALVFSLITSRKKSGESTDEDKTKEQKTDTTAPDTQVEHKKVKKSSRYTADKTIKKKVPVPNPNAARSHGATHSDAAPTPVAEEEPKQMEIPQPETAPALEQVPEAKDVEMVEMSVGDWDDFF